MIFAIAITGVTLGGRASVSWAIIEGCRRERSATPGLVGQKILSCLGGLFAAHNGGLDSGRDWGQGEAGWGGGSANRGLIAK